MPQRSKVGRKSATARRGGNAVPKRRTVPKAARGGETSETKAARLGRELKEALARQTATADVLKVISRSTFDLHGVLSKLTELATKLCGADRGVIFQRDGDVHRLTANYGFSPKAERWAAAHPLPVDRGSMSGRVALTGKAIHIPDVLADPDYQASGYQGQFGYRTALGVPLVRGRRPIGVFVLTRDRVNPFTRQQIELVTTFADQAVIAIENVRLFEAEQQRARELAESLGQQTATSEVLQVISSSPGDLKPVFASMLENAVRISGAKFGIIHNWDGEKLRLLATHNLPPALEQARREAPEFRPGPKTGIARMVATKGVVHIPDLREDEAYLAEPTLQIAAAVEQGGVRTMLAVPMLKENEVVGAFTVYRREVRLFTDKQIELVKNFAAQAVIAIENTRLLSELRARTNDLQDALARQTATSEILRVISQSPTDVRPVFDSIVVTAVRLLRCELAVMHLCTGGTVTHAAVASAEGVLADTGLADFPIDPIANFPSRAIVDKKMLHLPDWSSMDLPEHELKIRKALDVNSALYLPLLRKAECIGVLTLVGKRPDSFGPGEIAQAESFRDQALIAIENARLFNETTEALEQQTATSEVLRVISSSPGDLEPVFDAMLENAARLCEAQFGNLLLCEGDALRLSAMYNMAPGFAERFRRDPVFRPSPLAPVSRAITGCEPVHIVDLFEEVAYQRRDPPVVAVVEQGGARSMLVVPMLKEGTAIGALSIFRQAVRPFTQKQIELVKNFAAQAVIAIENTRLLSELRESLEQQTATSEVLRVISTSPGELDPVFATMLEKAIRICDAKFGSIYRWDGEAYHLAATRSTISALAEMRKRAPLRPHPKSPFGRMLTEKTAIHIADTLTDTAYIERAPEAVSGVEIGGVRTLLAVPMLKDDELIGLITVFRQEPRSFTEKQIALMTSFAAQAVIAIENTRLLTELRQRTTDLTESLEQQTATSEVLQVISSSPGDLQPVFATMLANAARICEASFGSLAIREGDQFRRVALHNAPPELLEFNERLPLFDISVFPGLLKLTSTKEVVHIADLLEEGPDNPLVKYAGARTLLVVPLLKADDVTGLFGVYRREVRPFTDKQIDLARNFAAQAVIAIENARLLSELRQRTDELGRSVGELRALGEVSQAVNSTLDLQTVLATIVAKAAQLSSTDAGAIYVFDEGGREFHLRATYGMDQGLIDALSQTRIGFDERNVARLLSEREPVQVADFEKEVRSDVDEIVLRAGYRARLTAPLFRGDDIVGLLVVRRRKPGAFPMTTVDLIKTFGAQSAVAIQNARLFENVETRTRELAKSLQDLQTAQDRLVQTEKLASLGQLTAGIAHEIKNPLNFVNNFSSVSVELIDELQEIVHGIEVDEKRRGEIAELSDMLRGNLDKVVQHGKRADSIVKNMLLHSRQGSGEHQLADINAIVDESLNLAYHGARAEKQGFNVTLQRSFDPDAGKVDLFPQEITRVLLNLISNGFYAATKRKAEGNGSGYEPTLSATTKNLGDSVEIRIRDNGTGIPPEVKEKMFNPFFTTKPAGEGTGLGLSLSHDIIVKQHSGSIEVDTRPGEFTEFRIVLPRGGAAVVKSGGNA